MVSNCVIYSLHLPTKLQNSSSKRPEIPTLNPSLRLQYKQCTLLIVEVAHGYGAWWTDYTSPTNLELPKRPLHFLSVQKCLGKTWLADEASAYDNARLSSNTEQTNIGGPQLPHERHSSLFSSEHTICDIFASRSCVTATAGLFCTKTRTTLSECPDKREHQIWDRKWTNVLVHNIFLKPYWDDWTWKIYWV